MFRQLALPFRLWYYLVSLPERMRVDNFRGKADSGCLNGGRVIVKQRIEQLKQATFRRPVTVQVGGEERPTQDRK